MPKICIQLYCSIVSATLRGITFLNNEKQRNWTCYSRVSVPLWGITFLNRITGYVDKFVYEFPSPYGELHFSIDTVKAVHIVYRFPSPYGELYFSIRSEKMKKQEFEFPSPYGELHFSIRNAWNFS